MIERSTINMFFPKGCTVCGGEIEFLESKFLYICEECKAMVSAHRADSEYARQYEPKGIMADKETNDMGKLVFEAMRPLYSERVTLTTKGREMDVALINIIFKEYCLEIEDVDGNKFFAYFLKKEDDRTKVFVIDTGDIKYVEPYQCSNIPNRDKAYIFLALKMGMNTADCKIKLLNYQQLQRAYKICHEAVIEARNKAYDN